MNRAGFRRVLLHRHNQSLRGEILLQSLTEACWILEPEAGLAPVLRGSANAVTCHYAVAGVDQDMRADERRSCRSGTHEAPPAGTSR